MKYEAAGLNGCAGLAWLYRLRWVPLDWLGCDGLAGLAVLAGLAFVAKSIGFDASSTSLLHTGMGCIVQVGSFGVVRVQVRFVWLRLVSFGAVCV